MGAAMPKQYLHIHGRSVLQHTLDALLTHPRIAGVVLVLAADDTHAAALENAGGKPLHRAIGGATRAHSVRAGLRALPDAVSPDQAVLVHDAARPLLRAADLDRLLAHAGDCAQGALLAAPVRDTLKRADAAGHVLETTSRTGLWAALTPQMAPRGVLEAALDAALAAAAAITDEAMALERLGLHPRLVAGHADNIKLTTSGDLPFAQFWLSAPPHDD